MGIFDYTCACNGKSCEHVGNQLWVSTVIVEIPLSDGSTIYLKGKYEEYGYVVVGNYKFYPEQFDEYFDSWFEGEPEADRKVSFLAKRVWTESETTIRFDKDGRYIKTFVNRTCFDTDTARISELTREVLAKCIRADKDLTLKREDQAQKERIDKLKAQVEGLQKKLGRTLRP